MTAPPGPIAAAWGAGPPPDQQLHRWRLKTQVVDHRDGGMSRPAKAYQGNLIRAHKSL